ncbi:MAG: diacylglycerol kinase family protein [Spirochaetota bacterium]
MKVGSGGFRQNLAERLILFVAEDPAGSGTGKNRSFRASLRNAVKGLVFAFLTGRNFRFESACLVLAVILGCVLGIDRIEWALLLTNCFFVLALEAKNTSLELSVDLSTEHYSYGAKGSKDSASGAVLLAALSSVIAGGLVFGPRLLAMAATFLAGPGRLP